MSSPRAFYSEWDKKTAAWLRELIKQGLIPDGDVDERSITEVKGSDLDGYTQIHFFAGIGGWPLAFRLAGWDDSRAVWSGSCPCQPYSSAGKRKGNADERNLWPHMFRLVRECHPVVVFGEQVESAVRHGWLDGISADLEGEGYAVGSVVLGAHSVGSPHIRQRLYWLADSEPLRTGAREQEVEGQPWGGGDRPAISRLVGGLADASSSSGAQQFGEPRSGSRREAGPHNSTEHSRSGGVGDAIDARPQGYGRPLEEHDTEGREGTQRHGSSPGFWSAFDLIPCRDNKSRRVEPGTFPLAHGVPARVVKLRGYGNAIVPELAAEFIRAYLETLNAKD